jgi:hypothetical protein
VRIKKIIARKAISRGLAVKKSGTFLFDLHCQYFKEKYHEVLV